MILNDRDQETTLALLIQAAGTADTVRLASLIFNASAAAADPAAYTFTRDVLTDQWAARWRQHLAMPGGRRPEQRVNRSLPALMGVGAVTAVPGPDLRVDEPTILGFLADRVYMAEALDIQHPTSNSLPVGEQTREAAAAVVAAVFAADPDPDPGGDG